MMGDPVLTDITKKWLAGMGTPLRNAIPRLGMNGEIMDEDEGIDLSEVPVCPKCGLEMANSAEHTIWHQGWEGRITDLEAKIDSLEASIRNLLAGITTPSVPTTSEPSVPTTSDPMGANYPLLPRWISDEEIRKYGNAGKNPYTQPPVYKSGDRWDR